MRLILFIKRPTDSKLNFGLNKFQYYFALRNMASERSKRIKFEQVVSESKLKQHNGINDDASISKRSSMKVKTQIQRYNGIN